MSDTDAAIGTATATAAPAAIDTATATTKIQAARRGRVDRESVRARKEQGALPGQQHPAARNGSTTAQHTTQTMDQPSQVCCSTHGLLPTCLIPATHAAQAPQPGTPRKKSAGTPRMDGGSGPPPRRGSGRTGTPRTGSAGSAGSAGTPRKGIPAVARAAGTPRTAAAERPRAQATLGDGHDVESDAKAGTNAAATAANANADAKAAAVMQARTPGERDRKAVQDRRSTGSLPGQQRQTREAGRSVVEAPEVVASATRGVEESDQHVHIVVAAG